GAGGGRRAGGGWRGGRWAARAGLGFSPGAGGAAGRGRGGKGGGGAGEFWGGYRGSPPLMRTNDPVDEYARVYFDRDHAEMGEALAPRLMNGDYSREFVENFFAQAGGARPIDNTLALDTRIMLVDDPVKRVDNMTMAWGLEARVPFLDHELVELAARIPADPQVRD